MGRPGHAARRAHAARTDRAKSAGVQRSRRACKRCTTSATTTGCGRRSSTAHTARILGPIHGFVGNVAALGDTRGAAEILARTAIVEDGRANWPPEARLRTRAAPAVVPRRAGNHHDRERLPRRGAAARRRRAHLGRRAARKRGEGRRPLSRHGRERLRAPEDVRAHRRRALARACARVRDARARAGRAAARRATRSSPAAIGVALYVADCIDARARFPIVDGLDNA